MDVEKRKSQNYLSTCQLPVSFDFEKYELRLDRKRKDKIFIVYSAILSASVLIKQRDSAQPNITLEFGTIPYVSQNLSISKIIRFFSLPD